jgi:putative ABC transport system permease protein
LSGDGEPEQIPGRKVTGNLWSVLGVRPLLGRVFNEDEDRRGVAQELKPTIYRVLEQANQTGDQPSGIVVRTAVEPASIVPEIRQTIWSLDKNQPVTRVQTVEEIVARQMSASTLGAFALLALLLASLGLYGVLSYGVAQRTSEIGVRMALGATANEILLSFGRRGLALTFAGLGIGLLLSAGAARLITTLLYGFQPDHLPAVAAVSVILVAVATLACFIPAYRASRIDPMIALRHE